MPDDNILKQLLRASVRASGKQITERQLETAVAETKKLAATKVVLKKSDLQFIGESAANDREIFAATDMDTINNILDRTRGR